MNSGPAQDVAVENFLRDIERRGSRLHCTVIGGEGRHSDMNLLYRKSRLDWRHRDTENNNSKKSSGSKDAGAGSKVKDMSSFRRHFRMGFMTMPASQELAPQPCASAMAPRSQSCHSVGGGSSMENGEPPPPAHQHHHHPPHHHHHPASFAAAAAAAAASRRPPAKPKRHPSTRLSSAGDPRPPTSASSSTCTTPGDQPPPPPSQPPPPPPAPSQLPQAPPPPAKSQDKRNALKKSDSGDLSARKIPPLKPKRSPNTQLSVSFEEGPLPSRATPLSRGRPLPSGRGGGGGSGGEGGGEEEDEDEERGEGEEEEPVYIEMVGDVYKEALSNNNAPVSAPSPAPSHLHHHPLHPHHHHHHHPPPPPQHPPPPPPGNPPPAPAPDSDSDQSEAIYEEMKYPLVDEGGAQSRAAMHPLSAKTSGLLPATASSSSSSSKPKASVTISHSSPLPSSSSSLSKPHGSSHSAAPSPASASGTAASRAPSSGLFLFAKLPGDKIPAPFPNLLQHRPPLLAFPQPAAASSGVTALHKPPTASSAAGAPSGKLGTVSTQTHTGSSSSSSSKLPVLQLASVPKEAAQAGSELREKPAPASSEGKDQPSLGPTPGLRARSHSTPLPPSSQSSQYAHYHHHHHHHHQHSHSHHPHLSHHRKSEKELPTSHSMKLGPQASSQLPLSGQRDKLGFLRSEKRERDRDRDRDKDRDRDRDSHLPPPSTSTSTSSSQPPNPTAAAAGTTATTTTATSNPAAATNASAPASAPQPLGVLPPTTCSSSASSSRPLPYRSQTPHPPTHPLPLYQAQHTSLPESCSPMLWTYPSAALKRPPAYCSHRAGGGMGGNRQGHTHSYTQGEAPGEELYWPPPPHRKMSFSHGSRETAEKPLEDARGWNGSTDTLTRQEDRASRQSGIPVRTGGALEGGPGRAGGRSGLPLPCQTFPACHRNGELGRLGRSASTSGVRQGALNVQRQCSLPRDGLSQQLQPLSQSPQCQTPASGGATSLGQPPPQSQQQQQSQQQLSSQAHHHAQLLYQGLPLHPHALPHLAQCHLPSPGGTGSPAPGPPGTQAPPPRDGKLLEVIERKRCLCKEIKAHRRPERSLCKQDSMPILPSWRRTPEPRKTGTPPCQRQQAVLWDTAI
ncbi:neuronal tyrosine-phosphorylated phosphoinositide-3-kinase adapter 1 [Amia ocellicauda]|uniref:neuronal tyrosine-phosphorylated phosphoinositide-3-kinase adapter 1 n=1 Tax=Amia ocellicauda TaxID=2972642 RepID=UPI0034643AA8